MTSSLWVTLLLLGPAQAGQSDASPSVDAAAEADAPSETSTAEEGSEGPATDAEAEADGFVACDKNFFHDSERTILVLDPKTLEQHLALETTGRLDDWLGADPIPFDDTLELDADTAVVTGTCSARHPLH